LGFRRWWPSKGAAISEGSRKVPNLHVAPGGRNYLARQLRRLCWIAEFKQAIALDPSDSWSYAYLAWGQIDTGKSADALTNIETAMRSNPHYPPVFVHILGLVHSVRGAVEAAAESLERASKLSPETSIRSSLSGRPMDISTASRIALDAVARYNDIVVKRGARRSPFPPRRACAFSKYAPNATSQEGGSEPGGSFLSEKVAEGSEVCWPETSLTPDDVRTALSSGHQLHGRTFETWGREHAAPAFIDKRQAQTVLPSGCGGPSLAGRKTDEFRRGGNDVCFAIRRARDFALHCCATPGRIGICRENEFITGLDGTGGFYPVHSLVQ
jgi:hypothetical protein